MPNLKALKTDVLTQVEQLSLPVTEFIRRNPITAGAIGITGATIVGLGVVAGARKIAQKRTLLPSRKKKKKVKRKAKLTKRQRFVRKIKKRPGRQTPYTAGARKDRSRKRIRYTKKGQPYVITASGKAKFIKKAGAKRSHRMKGGRY